MRGKLPSTGVNADADALRIDVQRRQEKVQNALNNAFGRFVFAQEVQRIARPTVKRILDHVLIGRAHPDRSA